MLLRQLHVMGAELLGFRLRRSRESSTLNSFFFAKADYTLPSLLKTDCNKKLTLCRK